MVNCLGNGMVWYGIPYMVQCWANQRFFNRELQTAILFHISQVTISVFKFDVSIGDFFIMTQKS